MRSLRKQRGFWGALAAIGGSIIGGLLSNKGNEETNSANNAFNAEQASLNRDFQKDMRNTQYQAATQDMMAAGLNPMLAYSQGGAGTPAGSAASASQPHSMRDIITPGISTAIQAAIAEKEIANKDEQNELLRAQAMKTKAEAWTELGRPENLAVDTQLKRGQYSQTDSQTILNVQSAAHAKELTGNAKLEYTRIAKAIDLLVAQEKSETERAKLTHAQTQLNALEQKFTSGKIDIQTYTKEIEKYKSLIEANMVQGSAEESKFQSTGGQLQRWIKTLNPLSGLAK